jgi:uncharacterized membrane protein YhaH (DUF805 family)
MNTTSGIAGETAAATADAAAPAERAPVANADPFRLAYGVVALVGVLLAFLLIRFTVNDAFISWRYGQSLLHGAWNWNPSSHYRVEAYPDLLTALTSVVPALLGIPPELFSKLLELGVLGGYLALVQRLAVPRLQKLLLTALALMNPVFFVHLFSGLGTANFALLIAALYAVLYTRGDLGRTGHVLAALVAFSRPEGMLYALVAEAWCLHLNRRRSDRRALAVSAGVLALYWTLRSIYFGSFFPNPYRISSSAGATNIVTLAHAFAGLAGMVIVLALLAGVAETVRRLRGRGRPGVSSRPVSPWRDATPAVLAGISALIIMTLYRVSSLQQDFGNRFCWQLLFPVALVLLSRPLFAEAAGVQRSLVVRRFIRQNPETPDSADATADPADAEQAAPEVAGVAGPTPASARWSALAVLIAAVTAFVGSSQDLPQQGLVVLGLIVSILVALAVWTLGNRVPVMLGVAGIVAALSMTSTGQILDWATYRTHLATAQEAIGQAVAADPTIKGVVAVEDTGIMVSKLRSDQWVLDLSGKADPFLGKAVPASVSKRLVAVIADADGPVGMSPWWGDSSSGPIFAEMNKENFRLVGSVMYAPFYWVQLYVKPGLGHAASAQLENALYTADAPNSEPSSTLLSQHLFDFPFLTN